MMTYLLLGLTLTPGQTPTAPPSATPAPLTAPDAGAPAKVNTPPPPSSSLPPMPPEPANGKAENCPNCEKAKEESKEDYKARTGFFKTFFGEYKDAFCPKKTEEEPPEEPEKPRRAPPSPFGSPFPVSEYQGYPLIGVPPTDEVWPLTKALYTIPGFGDELKESKIKIYGWVTGSGNFSTAKNSNSPMSYWLVPNRLELDQAVLRFEREVDSVQTDHIDYGFRSSFLYGIDYRYMTAGGWFSDQLLHNNRLNGFDPTEQYIDVYFPGITQGMTLRVGRWIACPDIETQFAPDNYMGSHSLLFTFDTYTTQTGLMASFQLSKRVMFQVGINAGTDMAPWFKGATLAGFLGLRWISEDNKDALYTCLNEIDDAKFRHYEDEGQEAGHDNFNYIVSTWEHTFSKELHTKTEGYFMWQRDAFAGGTVSLGPVQSFGGGGGAGPLLPGWSHAYGLLNYTAWAFTKNDYLTFRNEVWRDDRGMRTGFAGTYTSNSFGISHNFNKFLQLRPEVGYYRNWDNAAFDNGTRKNMFQFGFDVTYQVLIHPREVVVRLAVAIGATLVNVAPRATAKLRKRHIEHHRSVLERNQVHSSDSFCGENRSYL